MTKIRFTTAPCEKTPSTVPLQCIPLPKKPNFDNIESEIVNNGLLTTTTIATVKKLATESTTYSTEKSTLFFSTIKISTTTKVSTIIVNCIPQDLLVAECSWKKINNDEDLVDSSLVGYRIILEAQDGPSHFEQTNQVFGAESSHKQHHQRKFVSVVGAEERQVLLQSLLPDTNYRFRVQPLTVHGLSTDLYETYFYSKNVQKSLTESQTRLQSHNTRRNNDELTHLIIENALDPLSLSASNGVRPSIHLSFICIFITFIIIQLR